LADREALVPRDAGLVDAAERGVRVGLVHDVLALLEVEAAAPGETVDPG